VTISKTHFTLVTRLVNRAGKPTRAARGINPQDEYYVERVQHRIATARLQLIRADVQLEELEKELFKYARDTGQNEVEAG